MKDRSKKILTTQKKYALIIAIIGMLILLGISHLIFQDICPVMPPQATKVDLPVDKVNVQDIWMSRQENVIKRLDSEKKPTTERFSKALKYYKSDAKLLQTIASLGVNHDLTGQLYTT